MLIKEVDAVGAKALEHRLDHALDVIGLAVEPGTALTRLLVDVPAELRRDHDLVSEGGHAFAAASGTWKTPNRKIGISTPLFSTTVS